VENAEANDDWTLPPTLKTGQLEKTGDNRQATEVTKLAKPNPTLKPNHHQPQELGFAPKCG